MGLAAAVPAQLKHCIKLLIGHWYEHREGTISGDGCPRGALFNRVPHLVKPGVLACQVSSVTCHDESGAVAEAGDNSIL